MNEPILNIEEGGLSRLLSHSSNHDIALITAFRGDYSKKDNLKRNQELKSALMGKSYGTTQVEGGYVEEEHGMVKEASYFVVNLNDVPFDEFKNDMIELGKQFNQDSVLIIPKEGEGGAFDSKTGDLAYGPFNGEVTLNDVEDFYTRIRGQKFKFKEEVLTFREAAQELFDALFS